MMTPGRPPEGAQARPALIDGWIIAAALAVIAAYVRVIWFTPAEAIQGLAQKIYYLHLPAALNAYLAFGVVFVTSIVYLWLRDDRADLVAEASAEVGLLFTTVVLTTGPIWGRKAWGHFWVWDPRLTTTLLGALIFVAYLVLRSSGGEAEKKFSAALAIMGTTIMPIIHYRVQLWRGQHPTVITRRGGGLEAHMGQTLGVSFLAFTVLAAVLLAVRARMALAEARLEALRTDAASSGLLGESS